MIIKNINRDVDNYSVLQNMKNKNIVIGYILDNIAVLYFNEWNGQMNVNNIALILTSIIA